MAHLGGAEWMESGEHAVQNQLVTVMDYRPNITKVSIDTFDTRQHDKYKF